MSWPRMLIENPVLASVPKRRRATSPLTTRGIRAEVVEGRRRELGWQGSRMTPAPDYGDEVRQAREVGAS